jgi:hypothetical protein
MPPGVLNNGCCTDDEQPSKIAISLLGDAAEPHLAPRRVLPRHKPDPCFEVTRVCDRRSDGRGRHHAYPRHGLEAAAHIIGTMMGVNGAIQSPDLQFQRNELIDNGLQRLFLANRDWLECRQRRVRGVDGLLLRGRATLVLAECGHLDRTAGQGIAHVIERTGRQREHEADGLVRVSVTIGGRSSKWLPY